MRSLGFLLSRRWIVFALVVVVLAYAAWWLGEWQFRRLEDRKADNAVVRTNEHRAVAPVADVLSPDRDPSEQDEWRVVSATGTYDEAGTVVIRYRNRGGVQGVDVVVPLVTSTGTALLVDRGWLETDPSGADRDDIPDPPAGEVDVTGYVRANGSGDSTRVADLSARAISSDAIGPAIGHPVYGGFVELRSEDPEPEPRWSRWSCPSSTTGRTSSTGCSGGSSGCWRSSASATCSTTSGATVRAASGWSGAEEAAAEVEGPAPGRGREGADRAGEGRAGAREPVSSPA